MIRVHEALKKDDKDLKTKTVAWRNGVQWGCTLYLSEKFSIPELAKFFRYMRSKDSEEITEARKQEIDDLLKNKKVPWRIYNTLPKHIKGSAIEQEVHAQDYYNTMQANRYGMLACEYLMKNKGYGEKRLTRVIASVLRMDKEPARVIWNARQDFFDSTGIWIELSGDNPADPAEVI